MKILTNKNFLILILSFVSIYSYFLYIWSYGLNLQDEGFLWYGAWQTSLGAIPLVDFQSYDPFRYYWVASWFLLFDDYSIFTFRLATYSFGLIGLFLFLYMINNNTKKIRLFESICAIILLLLWFFPHWKIFEHTISIVSIFTLYILLKKDINKHYVYVGVYTSFLFLVGKNHALYMHLSVMLFFILYFFISSYELKLIFQKVKFFIFGYLIGLLPLCYMIFFVDGYLQKNIEWIGFLANKGNTNLNKEFLLPWNTIYELSLNGVQKIGFSYLSIYMMLFTLVAIFIIAYSIKTRKMKSPLLIASSIVSIFYFHYFYSRPDIAHMAQTIMPTLLLSFSIIIYSKSNFLKYSLLVFLLCFTLISSKNLLKIEYLYPNALVENTITNNQIKVGKITSKTIEFVVSKTKDENILVLPSFSTFYILSNSKSPIFDLFLVFKRGNLYQENMIRQLKINSPKYIVYQDKRWDGNDKLNFDKIYPVVYNYMKENYYVLNSFRNMYIYQLKEIK